VVHHIRRAPFGRDHGVVAQMPPRTKIRGKGEVVGQRPLDPASFSLVDALQEDPFYIAISVEYENEPALRRLRLAEYFSYSLEEARIWGRWVHLAHRSIGASGQRLGCCPGTKHLGSNQPCTKPSSSGIVSDQLAGRTMKPS
jgi:hypothetical protein